MKDETRNQLIDWTREFARTEEGKWLNDFAWESVPVKEVRKLPCDIVGMHFAGRIVLLECPDPKIIFPVYVHELRHVWQAKKKPLQYLAGKLIRPIIENDADAEEKKAENWVMK